MGAKDKRRKLFKDLKRGVLVPVYYLHGPDPYMLDLAVDAICEAAAPDGLNDFNHDKFRGRDTDIESLLSALEQLPFMVDRRVVILRDAQDIKKSDFDALASYFENPSDSTVFIVHASTVDNSKKLDGRSSAVKKMKKVAEEYEFKALYENEIDDFLKREAARRKLNLDAAARAYLLEAIGTDLSPLIGALDRLDLYIGAREGIGQVDDDLAREVIAETRVHDIFALTDALGSRDLERSLKIFDAMIIAGEPPLRILVMIARHFRILSKLKDPEIRRGNDREKAKAAKVAPYFLKDYERDARRFTIDDLQSIRSAILDVDLALKSSGLSDRIVLERLFVMMCKTFSPTESSANRPRP